MTSILVLGSTGSIGENTLRIVESLPGSFAVAGLAAARNAQRVVEQARQFNVPRIALADPAAAAEARRLAPAGVEVWEGPDGVAALAGQTPCDRVVCALVGLAALRPVLAAIEAGRDVALATKEVLVSAGAIVRERCERRGVRMLPVDSEHSAIFQCLQDGEALPWCVRRGDPCAMPIEATIRRLILTASGGPFAGDPARDLTTVTVEEALAHPRWRMGPKVTVDSATMMNKGLEILEAHWLFNVPVERIDVLLHPQSLVHSFVEFEDASMLAQWGVPDMRLAIQHALSWPRRLCNPTLPRLDLSAMGRIDFSEPDARRFPCLRLARQAARAGGSAPAVLNAANEVAVAAFLDRRIGFAGIWRTVEGVLGRRPSMALDNVEAVEEADRWARAAARDAIRETHA